MKRSRDVSSSIPSGGSELQYVATNPPPDKGRSVPSSTRKLFKPTTVISTGKTSPPWKNNGRIVPRREITGEEHHARIILRRNAGEVFFCWLLDRCRVYEDGTCLDYFERYCWWKVARQLCRTNHPKVLHCGYTRYLESFPNSHGVLLHKIDWEIWQWFKTENPDEKIKWYKPNDEPLELHTNEYLEISSISLRGEWCAFKKFKGIKCEDRVTS